MSDLLPFHLTMNSTCYYSTQAYIRLQSDFTLKPDICIYVLLVRSKSKISPSRFGLCALHASMGGNCFLFPARGAGGN